MTNCKVSLSQRILRFSVMVTVGFAVTTTGARSQQRALWETRVYNDRCPTDPAAAPAIAPLLLAVGSFLIPKLIDWGLSVANQGLQAKKEEELKKNDERNADGIGLIDGFYAAYEDKDTKKPVAIPALAGQCLVVVRGKFGPPDESPFSSAKCDKFKGAQLEKKESCDWLRLKGVTDVGIYLEARYVFSKDALNFRLEPNHFAFLKPIKAKTSAGDEQTEDEGKGTYDLTYTVTYESVISGQSTSTFAMPVLLFEQLTPKTVLSNAAFGDKKDPKAPYKGRKTSGWTLTLPVPAGQTAEMQKIGALYDSRAEADAKVKSLPDEIKKAEVKARAAANALLTALGQPKLPDDKDALEAGSAEAKRIIASELFDDVILSAQLDQDPNTNVSKDDADLPKRKIARQQATRANLSRRSEANELKAMTDAGLQQRSDLDKARKDFAKNDDAIKEWITAGGDKKIHYWGLANVKAALKEKPHLPTNIFLLTAADAFASVKPEISQFASNQVLQALHLQGADAENKKISDQGNLIIAANNAVNAAQAAETDLNALAADAPGQTRRDKQTLLLNSKISANLALLKACRAPAYPDVYGGNLTIHAC
jgi:hypothetical protein